MDAEFRAQIWPIFTAETREQLHQAGECLLALEQPVGQRAAGKMALLHRVLHSLKGGAGSLGFANLERLAHAAEGLLEGQPDEPVLSRPLVNTLLGGLRLADEMLGRVEAGVGDEAPADLAAWLSAASPGTPGPSPTAAPSAAEPLALELWPVFRVDVQEAVTLLLESARGTTAPEPGELARMRELATTLEQSGSTLGLGALEVAGAEVLARLAAPWDARTAAAIGAQLTRVDRFVAETDERLESLAPVTPVPSPAPSIPETAATRVSALEECAGLVLQLEVAMGQRLTPHAERRAAAEREVAYLAHRLKGTAGAALPGPPAALAAALDLAARALGTGPVEGAVAAAGVARHLVDFTAALEVARTEPLPAPAPSPALTSSGSRTLEVTDSVIRVSRNAVEALTAVLDRSAIAQARRQAQVRGLLEHGEVLRLALLGVEQAGAALRRLDAPPPPALATAREQLRGLSSGLREVSAALWRDVESERIQSAQLKDTLRELRTVPAHTLGEFLRRTTRETAGRVGKNVRLELVGGELRLDRRIVDAVREPLLHLLRNAVDHGIEAPQTRLQQGKPAEGVLVLTLGQRGGRIVFELSDDGAGLDLERIRERARSRGLYSAHALAALTDAEVARLIFLPGFSTALEVSALSGRGVGLDVVENAVRSLGGTVAVEHRHRQGTTFRLEVPRALGALLGLVVQLGAHRLVLPNDAVSRVVRLRHEELTVVDGRAMARVGAKLVPFLGLARLLGLTGARLPFEEERRVLAVVVEEGTDAVAFAVDELVDQEELVVHPLGQHLKDCKHLAGAAQLTDGGVAPVLQPAGLLSLAIQRWTSGAEVGRAAAILVVDDALSTRALIGSLLEIAGFEVLMAGDGEEAWALLQQREVALVITDVQMPRLDGISLTRRVRADARLATVPVVVITGHDAPDDLALGLEAGADAYLIKRDLAHGALIDRVRQLLVVDP